MQFASFDPSKKKKKKKVVIHDTAESFMGQLAEKTESVLDDQVGNLLFWFSVMWCWIGDKMGWSGNRST